MANKRKDKRVLVKVKDLDEKQLDAAIESALDALFGKEQEPKKTKRSEGKAEGKKDDEIK